jgi:hypothetical protein
MKLAKGLKIAAEICIGLLIVFLLFGGLGEMMGGDYFNGIVGYLFPAAILGLLMRAAWHRPLYTGILLLLIGTVFLAPLVAKMNRSPNIYIEDAITSVPLLLVGLLLLLAAWKTPKAKT